MGLGMEVWNGVGDWRLRGAVGKGIEGKGVGDKRKTDRCSAFGAGGRSAAPGRGRWRRCGSAGWDANSQSGGAVARQVSPGMLPRGDLPGRAPAGQGV